MNFRFTPRNLMYGTLAAALFAGIGTCGNKLGKSAVDKIVYGGENQLYQPPTMNDSTIKADTSWHDNKTPSRITYFSREKNWVYGGESYDEAGNMLSAHIYYPYKDGSVKLLNYEKNKLRSIWIGSPRENGMLSKTFEYSFGKLKKITTNTTDSLGRPIEIISYNSAPYTVIKYDNDYKITEKKVFDKYGILNYTITPKYNKNGTTVTNDTTWNAVI